MTIAVTGATGFTGEHVVAELVAAGRKVRCLVRPTSDVSRLPAGVTLVEGSLEDAASLRRLLEGAGALVKVSSLGFGQARAVVEACAASSVSRGIFFSTTSIFTKLPTRSGPVRRDAEKLIEDSGLSWTILRPTMIYGSERDRNLSRLIRFLARTPVVPLPGGGRALIQPVHAGDLACAVASVLETPATASRVYNLPGRTPSPLKEIVAFLLRALGRSVPILSVPVRGAAAAAGLWQRTGLPPRVSREQILRLVEDKAFSYEDAERDFGYRPKTWQEGLSLELERLRSIKWIP